MRLTNRLFAAAASRYAMVSVVCLVATTATVSHADLLAYYPMNETVNPSLGLAVADSSGNSRNGITATDDLGNGPTVGVASANTGLYGTAYQFHGQASGGSDYVDIKPFIATPATDLNKNSALTYGAWINPDATQEAGATIIGTSGGGYDLRLVAAASGWNLIFTSYPKGANPAVSITSTGTISAGVWSYVAITKDANGTAGTNLSDVNFYINGVLDSSGTIGLTPTTTGNSRIGEMFVGAGALAGEYYAGSLDEARIYNEMLDATTIAGLAALPTLLAGDVNGDHVVNGLDIAVVASHWLSTGATLGQGDANGDGTVNGLDIALIASHWLNTSPGPGAGSGAAVVPEPSTCVLALIGIIGLVYARRRFA